MSQSLVNTFIGSMVMLMTLVLGFFASRWVKMLDEAMKQSRADWKEFGTDLKTALEKLTNAVIHLDKRLDEHDYVIKEHDEKLDILIGRASRFTDDDLTRVQHMLRNENGGLYHV